MEYSYIHDSANREFDLVDAADTAAPESHALLMGCIIAKDPQCQGNRGLIHFGQDGGGLHDGTLYLAHNSIVHPFVSPLIELSSPSAKAQLVGNVVTDGEMRQNSQRLVRTRSGADRAISPAAPTGSAGASAGRQRRVWIRRLMSSGAFSRCSSIPHSRIFG